MERLWLNRRPVQDILPIEDDVFPADWAQMFKQREVNFIFVQVPLLNNSTDFFGLPVNDAGHDQCQATASIALFF
jgi:hypothetical protein